jgi:hypothetical protein
LLVRLARVNKFLDKATTVTSCPALEVLSSCRRRRIVSGTMSTKKGRGRKKKVVKIVLLASVVPVGCGFTRCFCFHYHCCYDMNGHYRFDDSKSLHTT